jgi:hypothetical protein
MVTNMFSQGVSAQPKFELGGDFFGREAHFSEGVGKSGNRLVTAVNEPVTKSLAAK